MSIWTDILDSLFTRICIICSKRLSRAEQCICMECELSLSRTNIKDPFDNKMAHRLAGRMQFEKAISLYNYEKENGIQKIIHSFKYHHNRDAAYWIGRHCANEVMNRNNPSFFNHPDIDYIIPVPLHPHKEKQRGYNQALQIARGISHVSGIPVKEVLLRSRNTAAQAKKEFYERTEVEENIFTCKKDERLKDKHILVVDDVLTTGYTMEQCVRSIQKSNDVRISILTVALA